MGISDWLRFREAEAVRENAWTTRTRRSDTRKTISIPVTGTLLSFVSALLSQQDAAIRAENNDANITVAK